MLLVRVEDLDVGPRAFWVTPGGGVEAGESLRATAVRELAEETGLRVEPDELVGPVAVAQGEWSYRDTPLVSVDTYFSHLADRFVPTADGHTPLELDVLAEWRWWSVDELDATAEVIIPVGLGALVRRLVASGWSPGADPVGLPWRVPTES